MSDVVSVLLVVIGSVTFTALLAARYGWRAAKRMYAPLPTTTTLTVADATEFEPGDALDIGGTTVRIVAKRGNVLMVQHLHRVPWWAL